MLCGKNPANAVPSTNDFTTGRPVRSVIVEATVDHAKKSMGDANRALYATKPMDTKRLRTYRDNCLTAARNIGEQIRGGTRRGREPDNRTSKKGRHTNYNDDEVIVRPKNRIKNEIKKEAKEESEEITWF